MNKKFFKMFSMLVLLAGLVACGLSVNGIFRANADLEFVKKSIFGTKIIPVARGSYNATVDLDAKKVQLNLRSGGKDISVSFNAPAEDFPTDGSWVRVPAAQTGQPYDILASALKVVRVDETLHREWEPCTYQECYTRCDGGGDNRRCYRDCYTRRGERRVEYRYVFTDWDLDIRLQANSLSDLASFSGDKHIVEKDYLSRGSCR